MALASWKVGDRIKCVRNDIIDAAEAITVGKVYTIMRVNGADEIQPFAVTHDSYSYNWWVSPACFEPYDDTACSCKKCKKGR